MQSKANIAPEVTNDSPFKPKVHAPPGLVRPASSAECPSRLSAGEADSSINHR